MSDDKGEYLYQQLKEDPESFVNEANEVLKEEIAEKKGFAVKFHRLELYGVCSGCS